MHENEGPVTNVAGDVLGDVNNTWIKATNLHNWAVAAPTPEPINFGVCEPINNFTGRLEELTKLKDFFNQGPNSSATRKDIIVVSGLGGIGKTQLVRKLIDLERSTYMNVIWIDAESKELIIDSLKTLAARALSTQRINALLPRELKELKDLKPLIEEVLDKLCQKSTLLIYDNVEKIEDIKFLLTLRPSGIRPNVVITSRIQDFDDGIDVVQLKQWPPQEAAEYISKALGNSNDSNGDIELLAEKLQYFPLALRQGTSYIVRRRKTKDFSIADYVAKCYTQEMLNSKVFQKNSTNLYDRTTFTTWSITIEAIQQEEECGQLAVAVLQLMAYFAPDYIQRDLFISLNDEYENDEIDFDEHLELAVSLLINYSMIDGQDRQRTLSIHRLVQEVIKLKLTETNEESRILRRGLQCITQHIKGVNARAIQPHAISVFVFALNFADLVVEFKTLPKQILGNTMEIGKYQQAKAFADTILEPLTLILRDDNVLLGIRYEIAVSYLRLGYYIEALRMNEEIFDKQKTIFGEDHQDTLRTSSNIANLFYKLGKYPEARQLYQEIFDKQKTSLGEDHTDTLTTRSNVAFSYYQLGKYSEALQLYQELFDKQKVILGEEHLDTLETTFNIANVYNHLGNYFEALQLDQAVFDKRKTILGEDHPDTLTTSSNIANSFYKLGKYSEALQLYKQVFEKRKTILGEDHPDTITTKFYIANACYQLGNFSDALKSHQEVFDKQKSTLGEDHPATLRTKSNLASTYNELGNYTTALQLYQEVLDKRKTILGEDHPETLGTRSYIANSCYDLGNYSEALELYQQIFDKQTKFLGQYHPATLETKSSIAHSHVRLGNYSTALQLYQQVFEKRKTILGEEHPDTLIIRSNIASSYNQLGNYTDALELYQQIYDKQKKILGEDHPDTIRTMSGKASSYDQLGNYSSALELYQQIYDKQKNIFGEDHPETLGTRSGIANVYNQLGNYSSALELYQQIYDKQKKSLGEDHPDTLQIRSGIANSYKQLESHSAALELYQQIFDKQETNLGKDHPDTLRTMSNLAALNTEIERLAVKKSKLA